MDSASGSSSGNPRHFARLLVAKSQVGIPTLGDTGVKFNGSRWAVSAEEHGNISAFDVRGAMEALQKGPDTAARKRVHPAALAHAERIARAQQVGMTLYGYKVFPDLTPGRAFMWGTLLAVWSVGALALTTARALDISSVDEIKPKMQMYFAPHKARMALAAQQTRDNLELTEQPAMVQQLQELGRSVRHTLGVTPPSEFEQEAQQ